jgi:transposase
VGYDAGKRVKGRKIHSLVDTLGLPIRLVIHSAGIQDRDGAALLFEKIKPRFPWLECIFADTGYNAQQTYEAAGANALRLEVVRRNPKAVGFEVIKRRWVVERTFSWFGRNRRLAKDFENLASTLLAFVTLAAIQFGIRRLAR